MRLKMMQGAYGRPQKNPNAQALGRLAEIREIASMSGKARAAKLSPEKLSGIAKLPSKPANASEHKREGNH